MSTTESPPPARVWTSHRAATGRSRGGSARPSIWLRRWSRFRFSSFSTSGIRSPSTAWPSRWANFRHSTRRASAQTISSAPKSTRSQPSNGSEKWLPSSVSPTRRSSRRGSRSTAGSWKKLNPNDLRESRISSGVSMGYQGNTIPRHESVGVHSAMTMRVRLLLAGILVVFAIVGLRLAQIQVIDYPKYRSIAQKQYRAKVDLPAARGILFDRKGAMIASNTMLVSYAADPTLTEDNAKAIARRFSKLFGKPVSYYLEKLHSDSRFVWLERLANVSSLKKIDPEEMHGLVVRYEPKRIYHDLLAGQLVGATDVDNKGVAGVESKFEDDLRGSDGCVIFQRDGLGRAPPSVDHHRFEHHPHDRHGSPGDRRAGTEEGSRAELRRSGHRHRPPARDRRDPRDGAVSERRSE